VRRIGSGYVGTDDIKTSTANQDIVKTEQMNNEGIKQLYKFSFLNHSPCHVIINNKEPIFLDEKQGFDMTHVDAPITSFVIVEEGVEYQFIGAY